jgi:hypothetical protein
MDPIKFSPPVPQAQDGQEPAGPSTCPVCGSYTIPLRGLLRCVLCGFVICEACEGSDNGGQP